jgi:ATP-binding cassette subfamily C protein
VNQGPVGRLASLVIGAFSRLAMVPTLPRVLAIFLAVNASLALLRRGHTLLSAALERDIVRQTARRLYGAIVRMDWLAFSRMRASDLTVALTSESERAALAGSQLLSISASAVVAIVYIAFASRISFEMTAAALGGAAALVVLLRRRTQSAADLGASLADAVHELHAAITDDLAGMKTIRSLAAQDRSFSRVSKLANRLFSVRRDAARNHANAAFWLDVGSSRRRARGALCCGGGVCTRF